MTFKFLLFAFPHSLHIIRDSRYAIQNGWRLDDISLCLSGNIAVSGHNHRTYQSHVCIYGSTVDNSDSRDKPTLLYHKQFTDKVSWLPRYISFIKPNSTEIVTCRDDEVQVIDYNRDAVLRSRKVNGDTRCLSVSESQIFIGLSGLDIVNIYDNDLNRIKSIRMNLPLYRLGFSWIEKLYRPSWDIAATADRLYVCTGLYVSKVFVCSQDSGSVRTAYTTGRWKVRGIAVNTELGLTAVLCEGNTGQKQIIFYPLSKNKSFLNVNVESGVEKIRISDKGRIVTGNRTTGEVKIYNVVSSGIPKV
ncbi:hypothetical protein HOLleu_21047 [Holothuria leucospilota]|uniref:Uncharacterized protein n=1 Tax=Holothuria leucospilota TaxID=206669 RepID=A0A9Q1BX64_HOLLE|nr:hypothetical protein HOLleu_21047 [Holothuria leucospilota]